MSGKYEGLQAHIKQKNPFAQFVPCAGHSLNLIGVSATESCQEAINFFSYLQKIYNFFSSSPRRWTVLTTNLSPNDNQKLLCLKSLSLTRWCCHFESVRALFINYDNILNCLENINNDTEEKFDVRREAKSIMKKFIKFETAFMCVLWQTILERFNKALYYCKIWQDTECMDIKPPWNKLLKACRNYIKWNLDSCIKCFNTFQCDILVGLLKQSDLVVHDEMQLFGCVASWLNYQSAEKLLECNDPDTIEDYMSSLTEHVMSFIRYPMILPRQMAQLLMVPVVKQNKNFFVDKMAAAMEYNLVKMEKRSDAEHILECTPRLYTCERWGNSFRVRTKTIPNYQSIKREIVTRSSLFDRERELDEGSNWEIEMYLKGMCFGKAMLMSWRGSIELPEVIIKTVRATIKMKLRPEDVGKVARHVRVAILVYAVQNKIVHVVTVVQKVVLFDTNQNLITIDDLMVYDAVNQPTINEDLIHINDTNVSYFMSDRIPLKFHVIITPIIPGLTDTHIGTRIQHVHI